jgi:NitT/TauT family transport system ATP-binding protein
MELATAPKIEIRGVGRSFPKKTSDGEKKGTFFALRNVNIEVQKGEFFSIVGPSGCGKSTLLDLLTGLARPDEGELFIDGRPITGPKLDCGIVLQGYALFPWRTARKNIEFGLQMKGIPRKKRREISDRYIKLVELEGFENHYPSELSGGMQQRVAIARVLAYDPEVLLMDEPFAAVDAQTRETMQDELLSIWTKTGKTIIFVTHSIEEAVGLSDRIAVLSRSPGAVREIVDVRLPRPRTIGDVRNTPDFRSISYHIWELLQDKQVTYPAPEKSGAEIDVSNAIYPGTVI